MKTQVVKARYYEETNEIIPLDPQPIRVNGQWGYTRSGEDEKGKFVVIDFITEESVYFNYDSERQTGKDPVEVIITEDEWNKPADTETMDMQKLNDVLCANAPTSPKSPITNLKTTQLISLTETGKSTLTIKQRFLNVWNAITSNFLS